MMEFYVNLEPVQGLDTHIALKIVNACYFGESKVLISKEGLSVSTKSVLGLLSLKAQHQDTLHVTIDGGWEKMTAGVLTEIIGAPIEMQ